MNERPSRIPLAGVTGAPALRLATLWWLIGWAMVAVITYGTLAPAQYVPDLHLWDKLEHATAFFGMTFWFGGLARRRRYPLLALVMALFGAGIEIAQGTMGFGRDMDVWDWVADCVGIASAFILLGVGLWRWPAWLERLLGLQRESA